MRAAGAGQEPRGRAKPPSSVTSHLHENRRLSVENRAKLLRGLLARASERTTAGPPVLVFDLDGTLMDNRPRTVAILHELGKEWQARHPEAAHGLMRAHPDTMVYGFIENMRLLGVDDPALHEEGMWFWRQRFFADHHIRHDIEIPGACDFVRAAYKAGAVIVYLTGRDLPNMALGSFASLRDLGFPIGVVGTELVTKPTFEMPDSAFKLLVAPELLRLGEVVAAFDNEPANCNLFLDAHPGCTAVYLDTQCAPDPPPLHPRVQVIDTFELEP
jgi:hypothetical protein